jgi:hypothetical protein
MEIPVLFNIDDFLQRIRSCRDIAATERTLPVLIGRAWRSHVRN